MASDGSSVVAAVPLFLDPTTQAVGSGNVSVTMTQSGIISQPQSLNIQDLPSVSSYGVNPGDIAKAVLNFNAMQLAHRLNAMQAVQAAVGNKVDSTNTIQSLSSELKTTIGARSDVDRLSLNQSLVIPAATLPDGTEISFDAAGMDLMERIEAIFLSQTFGQLAVASSGSSTVPALRLGPNSVRRSIHGKVRRTGLSHSFYARSSHVKPSVSGSLTNLQQVLLAMQGLATAGNVPLNTIKTANATNLWQQVSAISDGISSLAGFLSDATKAGGYSETIIGSSKMTGAIAGLLSTVGTVVHCWEDDGMWVYAEATGDTATANLIAQDMQNIPDMIGALKTLATSPFIELEGTAQLVVSGASTVYDLVADGIGYYCLANGANGSVCPAEQDNKESSDIPANDGPIFDSPGDGIIQVDGTVDVQSTSGSNAPLSGVELNPSPGSSVLDVVADTSGNFSMFIPLGDSGFDYANAQFEIVDPLSQDLLGGEVVNLAQNLITPTMIPTIVATSACNDTDAGSPDGDDPDCD